ncbi:MAG: helix-turn-helix domain-containing protein [Lachnospiraceae bacterium]|nr:helix-turn-helix domain-containing protein [Lachnospiraceae bacterium]
MIGSYLKVYMKNNGIKQGVVSEKTGIQPHILGSMLDEQRKMEVSEYYDICAALGVSPIQIAREAGVYFVPE